MSVINDRLRDMMMRAPFVRRQIRSMEKNSIRKRIRNCATAEEAFQVIYETNYWGNAESVSGNGSTLASTAAFRKEFEELLHTMNIRRLLDAPCGDFNWMKRVKFPGAMTYIGADIVRPLIEGLGRDYGNREREFMVLDMIKDRHPECDLWLCRDGLFHLSSTDIFRTLDNFVQAGSKYCLLTTHPHISNNQDIMTGFHREINLLEAPFNLPKPDIYLHDSPKGENQRLLGLWRNEDIAASRIGKSAIYVAKS